MMDVYSEISKTFFLELYNCKYVIPELFWEVPLRNAAGLSHYQLRFAIGFFAACLAGGGLQYLRSPTVRHLYATITGIMLIFYPFGSGIIIAVPPLLFTYLSITFCPRYSGTLAWTMVFPYLIYMHVVNASGEAWKDGKIDFTGGLMMLTLKLIAISTSRSDASTLKTRNQYQVEHALAKAPTLLEFLSYSFAFGNLLGGPFIEFTEYKNFMEHKSVWDVNSNRPPPSSFLTGMRCIVEATLFMLSYLKLEQYWNPDIILTPWYHEASLFVRFLVPLFVSFVTQLKYFFAWKLSEASMTFAGFSWLGWSPEGKPQWGRACNVRFLGVLLADSARTIPLNWNISTGNFLRRYVYERITGPSGKANFIHLLFTQAVSGIWHGLYPGYSLFFAMSALWIWTSTVIFKAETRLPPYIRKSSAWWATKVFYTYWHLNFYAMPFQILELYRSLWYWGSLYYIPHVAMALLAFVGPLLLASSKKPKSQ